MHAGPSLNQRKCLCAVLKQLFPLDVQWAQQGVLLLNAVLTVRAQQAGSHAKKVRRGRLSCRAVACIQATRVLSGRSAQPT